jgi:hypothetical protein
VKTLKNIAALAIVTALAVPAGVAAQGPDGNHGKSDAHAKPAKPVKPAKPHVDKRCKHTPRVGFHVKGTVVSYDAATNTLVIDVADRGVSKHAKKYITDDPLTVTGAKVGKTPPKAGDLVDVKGKIDKPKKKCPETDDAIKASVKYTRVHVRKPHPASKPHPAPKTPEQPKQPEQEQPKA